MYEGFHQSPVFRHCTSTRKSVCQPEKVWWMSKPLSWMKPRVSRSTSVRCHPKINGRENVIDNIRHGRKIKQKCHTRQDCARDVPSTLRWSDWYWKILSMFEIKRQHWGTSHNSRRTGNKHQIHKSRALPTTLDRTWGSEYEERP